VEVIVAAAAGLAVAVAAGAAAGAGRAAVEVGAGAGVVAGGGALAGACEVRQPERISADPRAGKRVWRTRRGFMRWLLWKARFERWRRRSDRNGGQRRA
jgi:hypothetical protein